MKKILLFLALSLFIAGPLQAADTLLKETHPDRYVVREGDTLWDIASIFLQDAWKWPEIWHVNPAIENPHLIYPGDVIYLTEIDGRQVLTLDRGGAKAPPPMSGPTVRAEQRVREEPIKSAIPAIPLDAIASMLTSGRIVEQHTLDEAPYVLAGRADRLIFGPGDEFYARGEWTSNNSVYGLFRAGDVYKDPETGLVLGFEAREVGLAKVLRRDSDIVTMELTSVTEDVRIGDHLLPTEERRVESTFFPSSPPQKVSGVIMSVFGGVTQVGRYNVVTLNRGKSQGLEVGNVLAIFKSGAIVRDRIARDKVQLPPERAGILMVFRVFDKMAYGLVLETTEPLRVGDKVASP